MAFREAVLRSGDGRAILYNACITSWERAVSLWGGGGVEEREAVADERVLLEGAAEERDVAEEWDVATEELDERVLSVERMLVDAVERDTSVIVLNGDVAGGEAVADAEVDERTGVGVTGTSNAGRRGPSGWAA